MEHIVQLIQTDQTETERRLRAPSHIKRGCDGCEFGAADD